MSAVVAVVTGTRAEFGLLRSTIAAIDAHPDLELRVVAGGAHLLSPARTIEEVRAAFPVSAEVEMQRDGKQGREADAAAVGRGTSGMAAVFRRLEPKAVVVLGDRLEAFAAAAAASIGGRRVVHLHGGDRAEGVADEAMRHAITALAHLHLPATNSSAARLRRMGEDPTTIEVVGSPAVDGVADLEPLSDASHEAFGRPRTLLLHHGAGLPPAEERAWIESAVAATTRHGPVLALRPNADPGSAIVAEVLEAAAAKGTIRLVDHLPRETFVGGLKRVDAIVGNSSAGLIEAAIVGCPAVNLGPRQGGRERPDSVFDVDRPDAASVHAMLVRAVASSRSGDHPYGAPGAGLRIAEAIAGMLSRSPDTPPRKRLAH